MTEQSEARNTATEGALDESALGTPIVAFDRGLRKRILFGAFGAAMVAFGVCGTIFFHNRGLSRLVGVGVLVLFLAYFFIGRLRVYLCPGGVIVHRAEGRIRECCRWEEISAIDCVTAAAFLKVGSRSCSLVKRDGSSIDVNDLGLTQYDAFVDALRRLSALQGIPWTERAIKRTQRESRGMIFVFCMIGLGVFMLIVTVLALKIGL